MLWLAPVIGVGLSMLTATLLAIVTRKLSGFHLAVATLMFGIVVHTWLIHSGDWAGGPEGIGGIPRLRSEEHTSELQSLMRISYAVFCLKKKKSKNNNHRSNNTTSTTTHTKTRQSEPHH